MQKVSIKRADLTLQQVSDRLIKNYFREEPELSGISSINAYGERTVRLEHIALPLCDGCKNLGRETLADMSMGMSSKNACSSSFMSLQPLVLLYCRKKQELDSLLADGHSVKTDVHCGLRCRRGR